MSIFAPLSFPTSLRNIGRKAVRTFNNKLTGTPTQTDATVKPPEPEKIPENVVAPAKVEPILDEYHLYLETNDFKFELPNRICVCQFDYQFDPTDSEDTKKAISTVCQLIRDAKMPELLGAHLAQFVTELPEMITQALRENINQGMFELTAVRSSRHVLGDAYLRCTVVRKRKDPTRSCNSYDDATLTTKFKLSRPKETGN